MTDIDKMCPHGSHFNGFWCEDCLGAEQSETAVTDTPDSATSTLLGPDSVTQ